MTREEAAMLILDAMAVVEQFNQGDYTRKEALRKIAEIQQHYAENHDPITKALRGLANSMSKETRHSALEYAEQVANGLADADGSWTEAVRKTTAEEPIHVGDYVIDRPNNATGRVVEMRQGGSIKIEWESGVSSWHGPDDMDGIWKMDGGSDAE